MRQVRQKIQYPADYVSIKREPTMDEIAMIKAYGRKYRSASLPGDIAVGMPGQCFDWCMMQVMHSKGKYRYVEGIAKSPIDDGWHLHAWITDDSGKAYDPTWAGMPGGAARYFGIEIPFTEVLVPFIKQTEYQGMIPNRWRAPSLWADFLATLKRKR